MSFRLLCAILVLSVFTSFLPASVPVPPIQGKVNQTQVTKKDVHIWLGKAREAMAAKEYMKAEKYLKKARKSNPNLPETYRLLGDFHALFNRQWKADKFYKKAESLERLQASKN